MKQFSALGAQAVEFSFADGGAEGKDWDARRVEFQQVEQGF
jgi:hypothetical protein